MPKIFNEKGFVLTPVLVLTTIVIGIVAAVYLSQNPQIFRPKAFLNEIRKGDEGSVPVVTSEGSPRYHKDKLIIEYKGRSGGYGSFSVNQQSKLNQVLKENGVKTDAAGKVLEEKLLEGSELQGLSMDGQSEFVRVSFSEDVDLEKIKAQIGDDVEVSYDSVAQITSNSVITAPNDLYYQRGLQENLEVTSLNKAWEFIRSRMESNEIVIDGNRKVKVAIIDSGLNIDNNRHKDLEGVNLTAGYNFVEKNTDVKDELGHGTAVSGIIAARTNNLIGLAGYQWLEKDIFELSIYKVFGIENVGSMFDLAQAVSKAGRDKARVINMSAGGAFDCSEYKYMQQAVQVAIGQGALLVASSGNEGNNMVRTPASCEGVISVGSVNNQRLSSEFTTFDRDGSKKISLSAPGENIYFLVNPRCISEWCVNIAGYEYAYGSGTSFSAPQVSAAAALLVYLNPRLSVQELSNCLKLESNTDEGIVSDGSRTPSRVLNVEKAVKGCYKPSSN